MPPAVQTRSRQNRIKYFKEFKLHATPAFRCYHGSRLPPRSFEGMWPHKKFFSNKIKTSKKRVPKAKGVPSLLKKTLKAKPKKRQKRGILKATETAKKQYEIVDVKPRKRVSFGKQMIGKRREQEEQLYARGTDYHEMRAADPAETAVQRAARVRRGMYGSRGDARQRLFRLDGEGRLQSVAAPRRRIIM